MYDYGDIFRATTRATVIHCFCLELKRGTFSGKQDRIKSESTLAVIRQKLASLTKEEFDSMAKNSRNFGGIFLGRLDEGGKFF